MRQTTQALGPSLASNEKLCAVDAGQTVFDSFHETDVVFPQFIHITSCNATASCEYIREGLFASQQNDGIPQMLAKLKIRFADLGS